MAPPRAAKRGTLILLGGFVFIFGCVYWFFPAGAKYVLVESVRDSLKSPSPGGRSRALSPGGYITPEECPKCDCSSQEECSCPACDECNCNEPAVQDPFRGAGGGAAKECPPCRTRSIVLDCPKCPAGGGCPDPQPCSEAADAGGGLGDPFRSSVAECKCPVCNAAEPCTCPAAEACPRCDCPGCPAPTECPEQQCPRPRCGEGAGGPRPAQDLGFPDVPQPAEPPAPWTDQQAERYVLALSYADEEAHTRRSRKLLHDRGAGVPLCVEDCATGYNAVGPLTPHQGAMGGVAAGQEGQVCYASCCVGCSVALAYPPGTVVFMNNTYRFERGGSTAEVMRVRFHTGVKAFVKFACVPEGISGGLAKPKHTIAHTTPEQKTQCLNMQKAYATTDTVALGRYGDMVEVRRVQKECGLDDIGIDSWIEKVESALPGIGVLVNQSALFTSLADGLSMNPILYDTLDKNTVKSLLKGIPSERIVKAAIHDLLLSEGDRHMGNVFLSEGSKMTLIDNDRALGFYYDKRRRGLDSVFLTNTYRNWQIFTNPITRTMDYRCHAEGGAIGFNYPPSVKTCMEKIAGMTKHEVMAEFRIPRAFVAELLQNRAKDMLTLGFEKALWKDLEDNGDVASYHRIRSEAEAAGTKPSYEWRTAYRPVPAAYCVVPGEPGHVKQPAYPDMDLLADN